MVVGYAQLHMVHVRFLQYYVSGIRLEFVSRVHWSVNQKQYFLKIRQPLYKWTISIQEHNVSEHDGHPSPQKSLPVICPPPGPEKQKLGSLT